MILRLVWGQVRRNRSGYLVWLWMVPALMQTAARSGVDVGWVLAGSMALAFATGGQTNQGIDCRENRLLPTTPRALMIARWLNATLVPAAILLVAKGIGMAWTLIAGRVNIMPLDTFAISTAYDFAYAGAMYVLLPRLSQLAGLLARPLEPFLTTKRRREIAARPLIAFFLVFGGLFLVLTWGLPFLMARSLPAYIGEFTTTSGLVLLFSLAAALSGLWWTPRTTSWLDEPIPSAVTTRSSSGHRRLADRFTGVSHIIWTHVSNTLAYTAIGIVILLAARPFLPARAGTDPRFFAVLFLTYAFIVIVHSSVWTPWARHMKLLPLSVRQVNALFLFTPLLTWAAAWTVLLAVHAAMGFPIPEALGPLTMLAFAAISAASHALGLWLHGSAIGRMTSGLFGLAAAGGVAVNLLARPDASTRLGLVLVILLTLTLAALINHRTLTRSTSGSPAYQRPRPQGV